MASKKQTGEDLFKEFDDLGVEPQSKAPSKSTSAPKPKDDDPLADFENLIAAPKSRPHTPKFGGTGPTSSPKKSVDAPRKSVDSSRSFHQAQTPGEEKKEPEVSTEAPKTEEPSAAPAQGGGGWWGSLMGAANAAVKQAEAIAKEVQKNEEAQRWAEQVKGNVGVLRSYGGELRSRALPTFTNILHTLAPPISSHERLQIHTTHDLHGYPSLDPLIYQTFSRVMLQVEGGDLMVIQRGQESTQRRGSEAGYTGSSVAGWSDGPWWKDNSEKRDLGAVKGLVEGTKLVRVSAESYAESYFASKGGVEEAAKQATEVLSESNPTRSSDIFLAIQAVEYDAPAELFASSSAETDEKKDADVVDPSSPDVSLAFAIFLHDPIHGITFHALSQSLPAKWVRWLDNLAATNVPDAGLPDEIREIIEGGGVDPREWVAEWTEEVLSLAVGLVAQRYVARRMGVGEGGIKGKSREANLDAGAGEAARAM